MPAKPTKVRWREYNFSPAEYERRTGQTLYPAEQGARPAPRRYTVPAVPRDPRSAPGRYFDYDPATKSLVPQRGLRGPGTTDSGIPKVRLPAGLRPSPGRFPGKWPLPGAGGLFPDPFDLADRLHNRSPGWKPALGNEAYMTLKCQSSPLTDPVNGYNDISHIGYRSGHVNAGDCGIQLQAWAGAGPTTWPDSTFTTTEPHFTLVALAGKVNGPGGDPTGRVAGFADRFMYSQVWWWTSPVGTTAQTQPVRYDVGGSALDAMPNPNLMRFLPGPATQQQPAPLAPGIEGWTNPANAPETWAFTYTPGGRYRSPVSKRVVPDDPGHERKFVPRSRAIMVALFNALDTISESAEIVDSFYEALPKSVRTRWEAKHARPEQAFIDNAGQYGIDGADWKARALYYNWDKVDMDLAVRNIIKNAVEDRLLGDIHKRLPANTINALSPSAETDPFRKLSKEIDRWMDYLLDEAMKG